MRLIRDNVPLFGAGEGRCDRESPFGGDGSADEGSLFSPFCEELTEEVDRFGSDDASDGGADCCSMSASYRRAEVLSFDVRRRWQHRRLEKPSASGSGRCPGGVVDGRSQRSMRGVVMLRESALGRWGVKLGATGLAVRGGGQSVDGSAAVVRSWSKSTAIPIG